jgi:hypothetical protein
MSISAKSAASTPPRAGADRHDRLALVVLPVEQGAHLEPGHLLLELGQVGLGLGHRRGVGLLLAQLDQHLELVDPVVHLDDPVVLGLGARELGGHPLGVLDVVPQVRRRHLVLEVPDLALQALQVGHLAHRRHRRAQVLDLVVEVHSHEPTAYASRAGVTGSP